MNTELHLRIGDTWYLVTSLSPNHVANPSWRLTKIEYRDPLSKFAPLTDTHYDLAIMHGVVTCTCGSSHWKKEPQRKACKHSLSLIQHRLIPANVANNRP